MTRPPSPDPLPDRIAARRFAHAQEAMLTCAALSWRLRGTPESPEAVARLCKAIWNYQLERGDRCQVGGKA